MTALVGGSLAPAPAVAAPFITVRCPTQNLQTAINNAAPGSTLQVTGTCTGNFTIPKNLTLIGLGATLDGNHTGTVVTVPLGIRAQLTTLTVTHGQGAASGASGIDNGGTLTLTGSTVSGNDSGLFGHGGGIYNRRGGTLTLTGSTVSGNTANPGGGGGIYNDGGTLTLTGSTVSGNNVGPGPGGGIYNWDGGTVRLNLSQVRANTAAVGGGIFNRGTLTLTGSTVSGNTATLAAAGGGGIYNGAGTVRLNLSRVFANTPDNCAPPGSVPGCTG